MSDLVPRKTMVKQGGYAIGGLGGGLAILIANAALHFHPIASLVVGIPIALIGLAIGSSRDDRTAGIITAVAGAAIALGGFHFLGGLAGTLLAVSGIGLLVMGGINLYKFAKNYRKRS